MQVNLSAKGVLPAAPEALPAAGGGVPEGVRPPEAAQAAPEALREDPAASPEREPDRDTQKDVLEKVLEVVNLLAPDRHLEYEVIEDADMVQIQVVNNEDGQVVRRIPADEIIAMVKQIHKALSERLDVVA